MISTLTGTMLAADGMAMVDAVRESGVKLLATAQDVAIEAARKRLRLTDEEIDEIAGKYGQRAVRIYSSDMTLDGVHVEQALREAVTQSVEQGDHVELGMQRIHEVLERYKLRRDPALLEQIMRTQTALAYSAGSDAVDRLPAISSILWGYEYVAVGDSRTRPGHLALNGTRLPKEDPLWDSITPPNGYNCRCKRIRIFAGDAEAQDVTPKSMLVEEEDGSRRTVLPEPDDGFDFRPSNVVERLV